MIRSPCKLCLFPILIGKIIYWQLDLLMDRYWRIVANSILIKNTYNIILYISSKHKCVKNHKI